MDDEANSGTTQRGELTPEGLLASLPEENPNPVLVGAADGSLLYVNPAAASVPELLTEDKEGIASKPLREALARALADRQFGEVNITLAGRIYSFELQPSEHASHVSMYGRDITARVETERSLRETRARFEAIALNSPAIMCLKDLEGRYIFANTKFEEVHGLIQDQILGSTVYDLFEKDIADPFQ